MTARGVELLGAADGEVLSPDALAFVASLQREFGNARAEALARRGERTAELAAGAKPDFLAETAEI